jgi:hypothetical protein
MAELQFCVADKANIDAYHNNPALQIALWLQVMTYFLVIYRSESNIQRLGTAFAEK